MKTAFTTVLACLLVSVTTQAQIESPVPPSIPGIQIPNAHALAENIFRGNEPLKYMADLDKLNVTDVLIFKTDSAGEVQEEIKQLNGKRYLHIPFPWKDIPNNIEACGQVYQALDYILTVERSRTRSLFFHCTVGEDRTGLLAGLYRIAHDEWPIDKAFRYEMCARGYEAGNFQKPKHVSEAVREYLTPLFLAMAKRIIRARENGEKLDESVCKNLKVSKKAAAEYICK